MEFNYPHMGGPMDCCIHDNVKKTYFDKSARQAADARSGTASTPLTDVARHPHLLRSVWRAVQRQLRLAVPLLLLHQVLRRRGGCGAALLVHQLLLRSLLPVLLHLVRPPSSCAAARLKA